MTRKDQGMRTYADAERKTVDHGRRRRASAFAFRRRFRPSFSRPRPAASLALATVLGVAPAFAQDAPNAAARKSCYAIRQVEAGVASGFRDLRGAVKKETNGTTSYDADIDYPLGIGSIVLKDGEYRFQLFSGYDWKKYQEKGGRDQKDAIEKVYTAYNNLLESCLTSEVVEKSEQKKSDTYRRTAYILAGGTCVVQETSVLFGTLTNAINFWPPDTAFAFCRDAGQASAGDPPTDQEATAEATVPTSPPRSTASRDAAAADATAIAARLRKLFEQAETTPFGELKITHGVVREDTYAAIAELARQAAEAGAADAQFLMFQLTGDPADFFMLNESKPNKDRSLRELRDLAEKLRKAAPRTDTVSPLEGLAWLRKAAAQGHIKANGALGYQYSKGSPFLPKDEEKAFRHTLFAAERGLARAQNNLGWYYQTGLGVAQDMDTAISWYEKAARQDDLLAVMNLANIYYDRNDDGKTCRYALKGARLGDPWSKFYAGYCYTNGIGGFPKNLRKGLYWAAAAAKDRDRGGMRLLGVYFDHGWIVKEDDARAAVYSVMAAELGDADGAYNAALLLWQIYDAHPDGRERILKYAQQAIDGNVPGARKLLADYKLRSKVIGALNNMALGGAAALLSGDVQRLDDFADEGFRAIDRLIEAGERE